MRPQPARPNPRRQVQLRDRSRTVETQAVVHSERSWWEHWSSGVVLILLIIALVAASIMAFNDRGGSSPGPLADASQPAHEVVVDLSKIQIPTLPEAELPVARHGNRLTGSDIELQPQLASSLQSRSFAWSQPKLAPATAIGNHLAPAVLGIENNPRQVWC